MTINMTENNIQRVFLWTGTVAHLVDITQPLRPGERVSSAPSLCNIKPYWPGRWFGADGEEFYLKKAANLPLCKTCTSVKEASERVEPA